MFGFSKKRKQDVVVELNRSHTAHQGEEMVFLDADTLMDTTYRKKLLFQLKEAAGINEDFFNQFYLPVIQELAIRFQSAPASEHNHHNYNYGLLDHSLEVAIYALRASVQFNYFPDGDEEKIQKLMPAFTYAVFVAAMLHDAAKAITDLHFRIHVKGHWRPWSFLFAKIPSEADQTPYRLERRKERGQNSYNKHSHELAANILLLDVVPAKAIKWINEAGHTIFLDMVHAVASDTERESAVMSSVMQGDKASVEMFMESHSNVQTLHNHVEPDNNTPLHLAYLNAFKKILASPDEYKLIINKRHKEKISHVERAGDLLFLSATQLVEIANRVLQKSGISIPKPNRVYQVLMENNVTLKAPSGDSLWWADFHTDANDSRRDLSYLVMKVELIPGFAHGDVLTEGVDVRFSDKTLGGINAGPMTKDHDAELFNAIYVNKEIKEYGPKEAHNQIDNGEAEIVYKEVEKEVSLTEERTPPSPSQTPAFKPLSERPNKPSNPRPNFGNAPDKPKNAPKSKPKGKDKPAAQKTNKSKPAPQKPTANTDDELGAIIPNFDDKPVEQNTPTETVDVDIKNQHIPQWLRIPPGREQRKDQADSALKDGLFGYLQQELDAGRLDFNKKDSPIHYTKYGLFIVSPNFFSKVSPEVAKKYRANIKRSSYVYFNDNTSIVKMLGKTDNQLKESGGGNKVDGFLLDYHELTYKEKPLPVNEYLSLAPRNQQY